MKYLFTVLFALLTSACSVTTEQHNLVGQRAPATRYYLLDGTTHALSEHLGKPIVIVFWDSSCYHCLQTIPQINDLAKKFPEDSEVDFLAISINRQNEEKQLKSRIEELGLNSLSHAFSGNDVYDESFEAFRGNGVPYIVLINKDGIISWVGIDDLELKERLIKLS